MEGQKRDFNALWFQAYMHINLYVVTYLHFEFCNNSALEILETCKVNFFSRLGSEDKVMYIFVW